MKFAGGIRAVFIVFLIALLSSAGLSCAGGSLRRIAGTDELPPDLPKDLKDRFEIKESSSSSPSSAASSGSSSKKSKKKKKKKSKADQILAQGLGASGSNPAFVYPKRRPEKSPIWVGERLVYSITYFGVHAGELTLEVLPFKVISNRKVYHIRGNAVSSSLFSIFYRLNDIVESFIDYEGIFSHRFHVILDETKQARDAIELNDSEKAQTFYWNRWNHKTNGYSETKEFGPIQPFSQDSLSALYYVRTIPLPMGAEIIFPVVSEGKTWEAVGSVLRREEVMSPFGKIHAIVMRPEMKFQGILKKSGDSALWLTDDERRIPIRLEAKVRIGTVVANLVRADLGTPPALKEESASPSGVGSDPTIPNSSPPGSSTPNSSPPDPAPSVSPSSAPSPQS